ncbi:MAG: tetratricopeptide repeat protein [Anaeromyxobacteraceae bacterium]
MARARPPRTAPPGQPKAAARPGPRTLALAAALAVAAFAPYLGVSSHDLVRFDDGCYLTDNPHVRGGLGAESIAWAFTTLRCANWHPLTWLSYLADVSLLGGLRPGPMLLENALWHALAAALLFLALARLTRDPWPAALATALVALHPLRVESVAWISERKDVLSIALGAAALLLWARHVERPSAGRYAAVAAAYAASLLAKPTLVTLPLALLLLDGWPLRRVAGWLPPRDGDPRQRTLAALALEKLPLLALAAASSAVTVLAQARGGAIASGADAPLAPRLATATVAAARYLGKTAWPADLAVFYPRPADGFGALAVAGSAAGLAAVTALAIAWRRRAPWLAVGWLWYLGTLVPVSGLVRVGDQAMADRYTYVPSIGLALAAAFAGFALAGARPGALARHRPRGLAAGALAVLAALGVATVRQVSLWRDHETLFLHALEVTGPNAFAQASLASFYGAIGRPAEALRRAEEAVRIAPDQPLGLQNLAASLRELGRGPEALEAARRAARAAPEDAVSWSLLGRTLFEGGRPAEAREALARATALAPDGALAWDDLASVELALRRPEEAERAARRSVALAPASTRGWITLGNALGALGRMPEAVEAFGRALALSPGDVGARRNLEAACRYGAESTRALPACAGPG